MGAITLTADVDLEVIDEGADGLLLRATLPPPNGRTLIAYGWRSAITNYYPPNQYQANGHLIPGAVSRAMTPAERRAYFERLLNEQNPP